MTELSISQAARASGLPAKTVRYYDEVGLISARRKANGYRVYDERHVRMLTFVQRARRLGFSVDDCRNLLSLYRDDNRASADVKRLARQRVAEVEQRIEELKRLKATLDELVEACSGDHRPDCPILDRLSS